MPLVENVAIKMSKALLCPAFDDALACCGQDCRRDDYVKLLYLYFGSRYYSVVSLQSVSKCRRPWPLAEAMRG